MRSTSHELSIQFGYLSSVCALFNLQPRPKRSVVIHFVPTVFVSKWPIIYATISLSCDFHFLFHPLKSQYIALPCKYFFSYLNNTGTASLEENFYEIIVVHVFFFFGFVFLLWGSPVLVFNTRVIPISVCLCNECIYCLFNIPKKNSPVVFHLNTDLKYIKNSIKAKLKLHESPMATNTDATFPIVTVVTYLWPQMLMSVRLVWMLIHFFACLYSSLYWN